MDKLVLESENLTYKIYTEYQNLHRHFLDEWMMNHGNSLSKLSELAKRVNSFLDLVYERRSQLLCMYDELSWWEAWARSGGERYRYLIDAEEESIKTQARRAHNGDVV